MVFIQPLDLQEWLLIRLAGDPTIFMFLSFMIIAILAARFKMPGGVFITVFILFAMLFASTFLAGGALQGILILIVTGVTYMIAKSFNRGMG